MNHLLRLIVVGKKKLPSVSKRERFFGFCEATGASVDDLTSKMGDTSYDTKTMGKRTNPSAHAAGQGEYKHFKAVCRHSTVGGGRALMCLAKGW